MTNSPQDAAEIAARLHRISGLTDNQIASLSLTLDPTQVDQVSDGVLATLVSGTLPGLPLNPAGGLPLGLPGAVQPSRYVGATTSGPPTTGTFAIGDFVIVRTGGISICTVAGTPGTWVTPTGGGAGAPPLADVLAAATSSGALTVGKHNPVDTSGGGKAMTLANASSAGLLTTVEKTDSSANAVTVTLNLRGTPASTLSLSWQNEAIELLSKADGSWWPVAGHRTKTSLDAAYVPLPASPSDGQAMVWNATSSTWVPATLPGIELDSATVTTAQSTTAVSTWTTVPGLSITPAQSARPVYLEFNGKMTSTATGAFGLQILDVTAGNVTLRYGFQGVAALVSSVGYLEWALRVRLAPNAASHNYVVQQFQAQAGTVKAFGEATAPLLFTATTR